MIIKFNPQRKLRGGFNEETCIKPLSITAVKILLEEYIKNAPSHLKSDIRKLQGIGGGDKFTLCNSAVGTATSIILGLIASGVSYTVLYSLTKLSPAVIDQHFPSYISWLPKMFVATQAPCMSELEYYTSDFFRHFGLINSTVSCTEKLRNYEHLVDFVVQCTKAAGYSASTLASGMTMLDQNKLYDFIKKQVCGQEEVCRK